MCTRAITASDFSIRKEFTLNTIKIFHFKITQLSSISVHCDKPKCVAGLINICLWLNMCTTLFIGTGLKNQVSDGLYCWNPSLLASSLLLHFLCRCISTLALFFFFFSATNCQLLKLCQSGGRMWITQVHVTLSLQNTNTTETHL